jgi:hypothetical protein
MSRRNYFLKNLHFVLVLLLAFLFFAGCKKASTSGESKGTSASKENESIREFAQTITVDELKEHVYFLSSEEKEGRHSGSEGARAAARYIAENFQAMDVKGFFSGEDVYFQKFDMAKKELLECYLEKENERAENWVDFLEFNSDFSGESDAELVFLGYGTETDFNAADINGKLAAFLSGYPASARPDREYDRLKVGMAFERGAIGYMLIPQEEEPFLKYVKQIKPYFPSIRYYLFMTPEEAVHAPRSITIASSKAAGLLGMSPEEFNAVKDDLKGDKTADSLYRTTVHMKTTYKKHGIFPTENVIGFIEGTDKKDEYIILSAHYDGRGIKDGKVCNGANDNATGVAAMLEIAEAFSLAAEKGSKPRRSVIFFLPAAEELLGLGSTHYVENPAIPLSNTILNINMDPLGREDGERSDLKNHVYIYVSKNGKKDINSARADVEKDFASDLRIEIKERYEGSDNVFFERKGIPALAYTTGPSKDNHTPGDTADKIQYEKHKDITRLIFATVWEIANRDETISRN